MFSITTKFVWRHYWTFWQIIRRLGVLLNSREMNCVYLTPPSDKTSINSKRIRLDSY